MLLLSRKVGQQIRISEDIVVVVRAIEGRRVKIGIEAPKETQVLRAEIALLPTASRSEAD
ncbi:MAG: carbon storage regulator [Planctomycetaceae bacterium]|nr:carbon storage regulator [Planctomycetaceae bacterium]